MANYIFVITGRGGINPDIIQQFIDITSIEKKMKAYCGKVGLPYDRDAVQKICLQKV